jgi:hypothetical protein
MEEDLNFANFLEIRGEPTFMTQKEKEKKKKKFSDELRDRWRSIFPWFVTFESGSRLPRIECEAFRFLGPWKEEKKTKRNQRKKNTKKKKICRQIRQL